MNTYLLRDFQGLEEGLSVFGNDGNPEIIDADPNADIISGLTVGISSGAFNFGMNWNGAFGHSLYNNTAQSVIPIGNLGSRNIDANLIDPSNLEDTSNPISSSTRYLESGDFIKLANATLSYSLGSISEFSDITLSLTGQNLLLITDYTGFDPEVNTVNLRNGIPSSGIEYIPYPSARTFLVGVSASF